MRPFCEIMVSEVFPTVRSLIAKEMIDELHFSQTEVALKMGLTQPAVSQYLRSLRGKKVVMIKADKAVYAMIKKSARTLAKSRTQEPKVLCGICAKMRRTGLLCKIHREAVPALKNCRVCIGQSCGIEK